MVVGVVGCVRVRRDMKVRVLRATERFWVPGRKDALPTAIQVLRNMSPVTCHLSAFLSHTHTHSLSQLHMKPGKTESGRLFYTIDAIEDVKAAAKESYLTRLNRHDTMLCPA